MEPSRADFCHPYEPYSIQLQFMKDLYKTINNGKVGIFESPTGTGKSLSLICGSLTWLRDHKRRVLDGAAEDVPAGDDPEWLVEAEREQRRHLVLQQREELEARLSRVRRQETERKNKLANQSRSFKKPRPIQGNDSDLAPEKEDAGFLPEEYDSDNQMQGGTSKQSKQDTLSLSTQSLLAKLNGPKEAADETLSSSNEPRIIFCSRTHSQLTQFVKELRRVKPPPSILSLDTDDRKKPPLREHDEIVKHLSLGSRKNLCINPRVSQLGSVAAINERCVDLQKTGVSKEQKCPFLPNKENKDLVDSFRDHALAEIHDIEDLSHLGRSKGICPYYAARSGIESTEILTLPYPLLLQRSAREALGVSVKGHVVIIDEAHNLMDAVSDTYSCSMTLHQIETATSQVMVYVQKFKNRLKGKNRMYITQMIRLLNSISDCLRSTASSTREKEAIITSAQLLSGKGVDQIQPYGLTRYLHESKLAYKVQDYVQSSNDVSTASTTASHDRNALQSVQSFLPVLMNPSAEGRFFFSRDDTGQIQIRYALLDPREHFRDIVEEARAVILAGGTMSPMSDYKDYLFSYLPPDRIETFSFGHVVPPENLFARSISTGPSGMEFDFTFEKRKSAQMIIELGLLFLDACKIIPDGVVAFFPSYDYLAHVVSVWKQNPVPASSNSSRHPKDATSMPTIFSALNAIKPIFHESKPTATQPPPPQRRPPNNNQPPPPPSPSPPLLPSSLLQSYTRAIDQSSTSSTSTPPHPSGALLLSITSGSLSEGINFSDRLSRAIFAIGLPYPNPHSALWRAKLAHIEATTLKKQLDDDSGGANSATTTTINTSTATAAVTATPPTTEPSVDAAARNAAKAASRTFYTNATLRAVNQSIGRAIRHRDDYAAILLVDRRWEGGGGGGGGGGGSIGGGGIRAKLPGWIREGMEGEGGEGKGKGRRSGREGWKEVEAGLRRFFDDKEKGERGDGIDP